MTQNTDSAAKEIIEETAEETVEETVEETAVVDNIVIDVEAAPVVVARAPVELPAVVLYDAIMGPEVQAVLTGNKSIDDFAASICDEANKAFN